jgi:hypothetical protein
MPHVASRLVRGDEAEGLRLMLHAHAVWCEVVIHFHIFRAFMRHTRTQSSLGSGGGAIYLAKGCELEVWECGAKSNSSVYIMCNARD